jgi:hypothetical protein
MKKKRKRGNKKKNNCKHQTIKNKKKTHPHPPETTPIDMSNMDLYLSLYPRYLKASKLWL